MTSHNQQAWQNMEEFDLEEALRIFCDTSTRSFLWGVWNEHRRAKILEEKVAEQRQIISDRDDRISELNNRVQAVERTAEDRLMRVKEVDTEYKASLENVKFWQDFASEQADTITEQAETIRELDDLLRRNALDYAQQLSQLRTDYKDRGKLIEMLHQNVADRDEDVRKLKMRIAQLEEDKERLLRNKERLEQHTLVISKKNEELKREVGQ